MNQNPETSYENEFPVTKRLRLRYAARDGFRVCIQPGTVCRGPVRNPVRASDFARRVLVSSPLICPMARSRDGTGNCGLTRRVRIIKISSRSSERARVLVVKQMISVCAPRPGFFRPECCEQAAS